MQYEYIFFVKHYNKYWFSRVSHYIAYRKNLIFTIFMILGLAPMDWITDCAYRWIVQNIFDKYGEKDQIEFGLWTEFMSANGYMANPAWVIKHLLTTPNQTKLIAQIHSGDEENLVKTIIDIQTKYSDYFTGLELNIGCPANTVMKCGWGSELLKDKQRTIGIIKALSENSTLPFSIKTRAGLFEEDKQAQIDFIVEASRYCNTLSIHGRTVKQGHSDNADRRFIHKAKELIAKAWIPCKVIWNGGINSYQAAKDILWNLDGMIIGQASIGNPRIFTPHIPSLQDKLETILDHFDMTIACEIYFNQVSKNTDPEGKFERLIMPSQEDLQEIITHFQSSKERRAEVGSLRAMSEFRKHLFQYIKWIPDSRGFKVKVCQTNDYQELKDEIKDFFLNIEDSE